MTMTPCAANTITPKMIRTGQMKIGDRIQLEDILTDEPVSVSEPVSAEHISAGEPVSQPSVPVPEAEPVSMPSASSEAEPETVPVQAPMQMHQMQMPQMQPSLTTPLTYQQMTPYLDPNSINTQGSQPYIILPQTPMTTQEFTETVDITDVQSYLGFLRTQIGRYMRIEQLMGSSSVENRYGFLVGIGSNFIILQEITSGNIMVIDLFTIRLTYIYYSDPVVPPQVQR